MGKVNKNKRKTKLNKVKKPNGNTSNNTVSEQSFEELQPAIPVGQILAYLKKPNIEERICGFQIMATILEGDDAKKLLNDKNIVKTAAPLICDESALVRCAAAGTLRNFSTLGLEYCNYLIECDVMNPLLTFFKKHGQDWKPNLSPTGKLDEDGEAFLQCVHLLWNLCECSGIPITNVNSFKTVSILKKCLNIQTFGVDIVIATLHCLCVILEDNGEAIEEISSSESELKSLCYFVDVKNRTDLLIKILAFAVLSNLRNVKTYTSAEIFQTMNCITEVLSVDLRQACNNISSSLPVKDSLVENQKLLLDCELQKKVDDLKHTIDAQQTALEIVTNMCSEDDDAEGEGENQNEIYFDDELPSANGESLDDQMMDKLPIEMIEAITNSSLVKLIWSKTIPLPDNVVEILKDSDEGRSINRRFLILQSRALFCMNNMISNLPLEPLEDYEGIYNIWIKIGEIIFKKDGHTVNEIILESGSAVMRAALGRFNLKSKPDAIRAYNLFKNLQTSDIQLILDGINRCENADILTNLIRMLGSLAQILNSQQGQSEVLIHLAEFLTTRAFKETELWVLADILDTLMDVFAEDETDLLAAQVHLIDKLTALLPIFKSKVKEERKTLGDHYATVSTVATNLPRFIKYKRHRVQKALSP